MRLLICLLLFVAVSLTVGKESSSEEVPLEDVQGLCREHLAYITDEVYGRTKELFLADSRNTTPSYWWNWTEKIIFNEASRVTLKKSEVKNKTAFCYTEYTSVPGFTGPQSVKLILERERAGKLLKSPTGYDLVRAVVVDTTDPRTPEMKDQGQQKVKKMKPLEICQFQLGMIKEAYQQKNLAAQFSMISTVVGHTYFARYLDPSVFFDSASLHDHYLSCLGGIKYNGVDYALGKYLQEDDESETGWMVVYAIIHLLDDQLARQNSSLSHNSRV